MFGHAKSAGDNILLYRLRWVLLAWMAVSGFYRLHVNGMEPLAWGSILAAFVVSQVVLLKLPPAWVGAERFHTVIFLLDLSFVLAALWSMDRLTQDLTMALSLTVFITALAQSLGMAALVALVSMSVYVAFASRTPQGFDLMNTDQLLDLPFLFIQGLHGAVIVTEMRFRQEMAEALHSENKVLQRKLGGSLLQLREKAGEAVSWVESIPDAALVLSAGGEVLAFNARAEAAFELRRSLVLRRTLAEIGFFEPLRRVLEKRDGDGAIGVAEFKTKSGRVVPMAVRAGLSRDEDGHLRNIGVVFGPWNGPLPVGAVLLSKGQPEPGKPSIVPLAETAASETL